MYTPKLIRKNDKKPTSEPTKIMHKRTFLNFAEKEMVILKLGFNEEKLALDNGSSPSTIYRIRKKKTN